ncbi:ABC-2 transporter permease [Virgibacillus natechei]
MKGLLLNQYYIVEKSVWSTVPLGLLIATVLLFFDNLIAQRLAALLPIIFMASTALEVLKHESISGWDKYVLTLPVKRNRIVQSHYLFFAVLTLVGLLIICIAFMLVQYVFGQTPSTGYVYSVMNVLGLMFTMGFVAYPMTYLLGTEKAEKVAMVSTAAGLGAIFLSSLVYQLLIVPLDVLQGLNHDLLFSLSFMIITFILFIISYAISIQIYKRKEV